MTAPAQSLDLLAALTDHVGEWGPMATDLQWADAKALLDPDGPRRHWQGRAKGYSKTRDAAATSIVALLTQFPVGSDEKGYVAASDSDQATLLRQSVQAFVDGTPALRGEIQVDGRKIIAPRRGTELHILAADTAGSHGLRPCWLIVDELANWNDTVRSREFFDSLWAGLTKTAGRGLVITTAGSPAHFARDVLDAARGDRMWRVSDVHGPPPWVDPADVESEKRRLLPSVYGRLWENEWTEADDAIADADDVDAACTLRGPLPPEEGRRYVCTLDLGTRNDRTVAVIAHSVPMAGEEGRRVVVDRMEVWTPRRGAPVELDEVRKWLAYFCPAYRAPLHYDPSQAYLLVEQLRQAGVACHEFVFSASSVGSLATALMQALRTRRITLPGDEELRKELLSVRLRESSPNVLRIDHKSGRHDDRVIATAMACHVLMSRPSPPAVLFADQTPTALDGQPLPHLVGPYAMAPDDAFFLRDLVERS
ncbi:MAG: terminase large subunit domain-containing protein [Acidimicrobiales bacterium]